ncbi:MAG: YqeG family HAD IIIA-type phosphatase [Oscillospiraceae bacterium]
MPLFEPYADFKTIIDIKPSYLKEIGIKGLILDVDNTLTTHDNPVPLENLDKWLEEIKKSGIIMMIVSNNHSERVEPFAKLLDLDYVSDGKKPLSDGFKRAANLMKLSKKEIAVVGDQIFTDILGGNLWGAKTILVQPIELEKTRFFKVKRCLEKPIIKRYNKRNASK